MREIVLVAAVAKNRVIGSDNRLLWRLKSDMRHFRTLTMGRPVIVGRKTFESIGVPLPGRKMIIITRQAGYKVDGADIVGSPEEALVLAERLAEADDGPIMVAGGGEIYAQFLSAAHRIEITDVALEPEGDAHFPMIDPALWRISKREEHPAGPDNEAAFAFVTYLRR